MLRVVQLHNEIYCFGLIKRGLAVRKAVFTAFARSEGLYTLFSLFGLLFSLFGAEGGLG